MAPGVSGSKERSCVRVQMVSPVRGLILMIAKLDMFDSYLSATRESGSPVVTTRSPVLMTETTRLPSGATFIPWTVASRAEPEI